VLLSREEGQDFWYLPGGRVEIRETARDSLRRELAEELGCEAEIGRMVWTMENFFEFDGTEFHEVGLYFVATLPEAARELRVQEFERNDESETRLIFRWIELDELGAETVLPSFLVEGLRNLPECTEHVVHRDERPFERA
jgi:ADP-ribose pyrophosphatase YjhB (NUDIX family)